MSAISHRNPEATPPTAVRGDGCYVVFADGKPYPASISFHIAGAMTFRDRVRNVD